jgi:hypothetical protein
MPDITVHRHGSRWAVREQGSESPIEEFPSREAAEMAARQRAGGGTVRVEEDDPTSLEAEDRAGGADPDHTPDVDGLAKRERIRTEQGGL